MIPADRTLRTPLGPRPLAERKDPLNVVVRAYVAARRAGADHATARRAVTKEFPDGEQLVRHYLNTAFDQPSHWPALMEVLGLSLKPGEVTSSLEPTSEETPPCSTTNPD